MSKQDEESRLYFLLRSWLMSQIAAVIFLIFVLYLGRIDFIQSLLIGAVSFIGSLSISRLCEKVIDNATKKLIKFFTKHQTIKNFILKHF